MRAAPGKTLTTSEPLELVKRGNEKGRGRALGVENPLRIAILRISASSAVWRAARKPITPSARFTDQQEGPEG